MDVNSYFDNLSGTEAIDRFVAVECGCCEELNETEQVVWLHLLIALSYMQRNGHSCLALDQVAERTLFSGVTSSDDGESIRSGYTFESLTVLISTVKRALTNNRLSHLFAYRSGKLYSRRYYEFEQEIADAIVQRTHFSPLSEEAMANVRALWPALFPTSVASEQDWQQVAVAKSLVQRFSVINGGPGTGKTYTVLRLILALQACDDTQRIVLAAPTGKAQQRMTESIVDNVEKLSGKVEQKYLDKVPTNALTIHRLLGLREYGVATRYNQSNPLPLDVLIVDEASMVDLALMARIIRALPSHAKLYFIGDAEQLPAVELGNVLEQLVDGNDADALHAQNDTNGALGLSGAVPSELRQHIASLCPHLPLLPVDETAKSWVHTLQAPQRFEGQIAEVASAIQRGDSEQALTLIHCDEETPANISRLRDGVFILPESAATRQLLISLAKESFSSIFKAQNAHQALAQLNRVRWLTPVRKGYLGVEALNQLVFDAIKPLIVVREGAFYQGQPIMIVKNSHSQHLANGEVGIVWPDENGKLFAWFETQQGSLRHISLSRLPAHESVFAMTIHKSQGSEFDYVVLILPTPESEKAAALFHRGLVYTGLTRAKKGGLFIADTSVFSAMIEKRDTRFSGLNEAIAQCTQAHV